MTKGILQALGGAACAVALLLAISVTAGWPDAKHVRGYSESGLPLGGGTLVGDIDMDDNFIHSSTGALELGANCTGGTGEICTGSIMNVGTNAIEFGSNVRDIAASGSDVIFQPGQMLKLQQASYNSGNGDAILWIYTTSAADMRAPSGIQHGIHLEPELNQTGGSATFSAIKVDVEVTAQEGIDDKLLDLHWDAVEQFAVSDAGLVTYHDRASFGVTSRTWNYDDMVDGGGASGTIDFATDIPDGAIALRSICHTLTGFAGDTSAAITLGDGTDVDRYNTGTPSVFTTNASGCDLGAVSGTAWHDDAKTVTATITSNGDFTSVSAGTITCAVYYYAP